MSLSDATKATAHGKPTIWREIKARLSATPTGPQWLSSAQRRSRRRLFRMLMVEVLRDELRGDRR
ncbi:MAG: hypothetical protein AB7V13_23190 [Pseudorhodoplanes sp.]|uniref:hypothetical protein n=1 Tax=Pseudorhodoplanes sp. TaxID=1934341 RepID=UPI003D0CE169